MDYAIKDIVLGKRLEISTHDNDESIILKIEFGADVNPRDNWGSTLLIVADKYDDTPLSIALYRKKVWVVELLKK